MHWSSNTWSFKTEGVEIEFREEAIREIARMSAKVNERTENIGARRLQTVLEKCWRKFPLKHRTWKTKILSLIRLM